ncbi:hypothetical protein JOD31_003464 [Methylopila capsulata]|uniref:Uncharacterized protein n=1 Tax=Methylopila capsulata TaxID=61654 RepID=A0A9W6IW23_9HYPH|nr:hypothetical protein [Methylopila capsulata]MBM7853213.1 hypothetical protein [Methylopila capsulata]GLK57573.1 hypothetical protein GCM10008170_35930 [Methylopila capsulata]
MQVFHSVSDAIQAIKSYNGAPEEFELRVSNELLDPVGINMAIITDEILARDWTPNGYEQFDEFRLFRYRSDASD